MGGICFSLNILWSQIFPFICLSLSNGDTVKIENLNIVLIGLLCWWLTANIVFFCTIDLTYLHTFWDTQTASQYTCDWFINANCNRSRFSAAFETRLSFKDTIKDDIVVWSKANIAQLKAENAEWFNADLVPDEYIPKEIFVALGGAKRKKSVPVLFERGR